ncbi:MAG: hypothetical protein J6036_03315 [Clostridia bacterium]|nr:hypothetical protein [Clostridia bacterium]
MSDVSSERIKELLSNPENLNLIASIAGGLSGKKNENAPDESKAVFQAAEEELPPAKTTSAITDKRIALLNAIKPYVSERKRERVEGLVKAISIAGLISNYRDYF